MKGVAKRFEMMMGGGVWQNSTPHKILDVDKVLDLTAGP